MSTVRDQDRKTLVDEIRSEVATRSSNNNSAIQKYLQVDHFSDIKQQPR